MSKTVPISVVESDAQHPRSNRLSALLANKPELYLVPATFVIVMTVWEGLVALLRVPAFILPGPLAIGEALVNLFRKSQFWNHLGVTTTEVLLGYGFGVAIALILGTAISQMRIIEKSLMAYVVAFQTIPSVALAPLFVVWFGFGQTSKVVMAAIISFFPILINVIAGLKSSEQDQLQMMRSFGSNAGQVFWKIKIPNALPYIFTGLKIGTVFALVGAVVGEFVGAKEGLGYLILQYNYQFNIAGMFSVLIVLAAVGMTLHSIIAWIEKRVVFWAGEDSHVS